MKIILLGLCLLLFSACGPSGNDGRSTILTNNTKDEEVPISFDNSVMDYSTITVQIGPIMFSHIEDANGQLALNYGYSNIYIFTTPPKLPIKAKGGYIDTNRNNLIDSNDTILDIQLSSYSNIISPITTIIDNNNSILKDLMNMYGFTEKELQQEIPSHTSSMMIILNNAFFKALHAGYKYNTPDFIKTIKDVNSSYWNDLSMLKITNLELLSSVLEKQILNELNTTKVTIENLKDINTTLHQQNLQIIANNFSRTVTVLDQIDTIWNFLIPINTDQNISNFSLGIHLEKISSGATANLIISGASLNNNKMTDATNVKVFGKKADNTTGSMFYDKTKDIPKGAIKLFSNKLLINISYLLKQQTLVSQSTFTSPSTYNVSIYSNKLDINGTQEHNTNNLQIGYNKYFSFDPGSNLLTGKIIIEQ